MDRSHWPRAVKLQIKRNGAWRDVLRFDAELADVHDIKWAATSLVRAADPDGKTTLRLATADMYQKALAHWDSKKGWVAA